MVKKVVILFIMILCFSNIALSTEVDDELEYLANLLKTNNTAKDIKIVNDVVEHVIDYKYYKHSRGFHTTWAEKEGDCTDKAMLKQRILGKMGYETRLAHGYDDDIKHDYLFYKINNDFYTDEIDIVFIGYGIW